MKILECMNGKTLSAKDKYRLCMMEGRSALGEFNTSSPMRIKNWVVYTAEINSVESKNIALETEDGTIYVTNSVAFIDRFSGLREVFGNELKEIMIVKQRSKSGGKYTTCEATEEMINAL